MHTGLVDTWVDGVRLTAANTTWSALGPGTHSYKSLYGDSSRVGSGHPSGSRANCPTPVFQPGDFELDDEDDILTNPAPEQTSTLQTQVILFFHLFVVLPDIVTATDFPKTQIRHSFGIVLLARLKREVSQEEPCACSWGRR